MSSFHTLELLCPVFTCLKFYITFSYVRGFTSGFHMLEVLCPVFTCWRYYTRFSHVRGAMSGFRMLGVLCQVFTHRGCYVRFFQRRQTVAAKEFTTSKFWLKLQSTWILLCHQSSIYWAQHQYITSTGSSLINKYWMVTIPNDVRCAPSLSSFKSRLKTYLFRSVYKD